MYCQLNKANQVKLTGDTQKILNISTSHECQVVIYLYLERANCKTVIEKSNRSYTIGMSTLTVSNPSDETVNCATPVSSVPRITVSILP